MQSTELGLKAPGGRPFLTIVAMLISLVSSAGAQTPEALSPLPDGQSSAAVAINARGEVVGFSESEARGINDRGEVVGRSWISFARFTAVVCNRQGIPTSLPPLPGDRDSEALGINSQGDVVGTSYGEGLEFTAVVWRRHPTQRRGPRGERR